MSVQSDQQHHQQYQNQNQNHYKYNIGSGTTITHAVRLLGGTNILCSLQEVLIQLATTKSTTNNNNNISTNACFVVTAVGSLSNVTIRMSSSPKLSNDDTTTTKKENYEQHIRTWNENLEIVSLVGTFGLQQQQQQQQQQQVSDNNNNSNDISTIDTDTDNTNTSSSITNTIYNLTKHLHIVVSDANGICYGGHLIDGIIFTTIELVFGTFSIGNNIMFDRIYDPNTGYKELFIRTNGTKKSNNTAITNGTTSGTSNNNAMINNTCSDTNHNNDTNKERCVINNSKENSVHVTTTTDDKVQDEIDDNNDENDDDDNQLYFLNQMDVNALQDDDINSVVVGSSTSKRKNVVRDWGIPTFKDQIDNGITTFLFNDCLTINLNYRQNSTGSDVWDSAIVLANALERIDFVQQYITSSTTNNTNTTKTTSDGTSVDSNSTTGMTLQDLTVLELGSGTGLVGLYCSKQLGAKHVYVSDLYDNLPLLQRNIKENHLQNTVISFELDWTKSIQEQIQKFQQKQQQEDDTLLTNIDLIIGSDLFLPYDKTLLQSLAICINELLINYNPNAIVILCYEERFDCSNFFNYIQTNFIHLHIQSICNNYLHPIYQDPTTIKLIQITYNKTNNNQ